MTKKQIFWKEAIARREERFKELFSWYPYPAVFCFALVMMLVGKIFPGLNPRLGHPANVISYPAPVQPDGAIYLSVAPQGQDIIVTTSDRKIFRWPVDITDLGQVESFKNYLVERVKTESINAAIAGEVHLISTMVIIAADETLKYHHIKPILYALAEAKITKYGFETKLSHAVTSAPVSHQQSAL